MKIKPSKITFLLVNLLYLTIVLLVLIESLTFDEQGGLVPLVIGIPTLGMLFLTLGNQFLPPLLNKRVSAKRNPEEALLDVASWSNAIPIIGWTVGLFLLIFLIGFQLNIPLYTFSFLRFHGRVSWKKCVIMAGALWLLVYVSFGLLLHKSLFEGILFDAVLPLL